MNKIKSVEVLCDGAKAGTLALVQNQFAAFEYDARWLAEGFSLNPLSLPLENKVFTPKWHPFEGLFGVFDDSLPDGWGRLLVDRLLLKEGVDPEEVDALNRLAIVGAAGMGALSYRPQHVLPRTGSVLDLDHLANECAKMLATSSSEDLDELFRLGGSSGGARPKVLTSYKGQDWIIKFPSSVDAASIGKIEYDYALCARDCGIAMAETKLFPSKECEGYFGTRRFDRINLPDGGKKRVHMVSAGGLLETSHRIPNLDYHQLMRLTLFLTNSYDEIMKLFRLMCFNVYAHNRDDHAKNFSYLYDGEACAWKLSPAYDLTYSSSLRGEHATTVNGEGANPTLDDLLAVATRAGIAKSSAQEAALEIKEKTLPLRKH